MKTLMTLLAMTAAFTAAYGAASVGESAPDFTLPSIEGETHALSDFKGKVVVLEWTNYDCPFVKKHYETRNMQELQAAYTSKGVVWLSINSSAPGKQGHFSPEEWQNLADERRISATAVLLDNDGKVGKLYGAKTTPHMFIIDSSGLLVYAGAIDDNSSFDPRTVPNAVNYVKQALNELSAGQPVSEPVTQPYGCSVKY